MKHLFVKNDFIDMFLMFELITMINSNMQAS